MLWPELWGHMANDHDEPPPVEFPRRPTFNPSLVLSCMERVTEAAETGEALTPYPPTTVSTRISPSLLALRLRPVLLALEIPDTLAA